MLNQRNFSLFMQNPPEWKKENGRKNVTEMQNRRDTIPNQRTKPASNAGLMDKGHRMASGTMDETRPEYDSGLINEKKTGAKKCARNLFLWDYATTTDKTDSKRLFAKSLWGTVMVE